jgi:hypothetical protein
MVNVCFNECIMKSNNFLQNIQFLVVLILSVIKLSIMIGVIYFISIFYIDIIDIFKNYNKGNKLPSYKLDDIVITIDDDFNKHSKSIFQKINEKWLHGEKQHIKVTGYNNINIIIDGAVNKNDRNIMIKKELCVIYDNKHKEEVDLNKKRVFDILKEFYC